MVLEAHAVRMMEKRFLTITPVAVLLAMKVVELIQLAVILMSVQVLLAVMVANV